LYFFDGDGVFLVMIAPRRALRQRVERVAALRCRCARFEVVVRQQNPRRRGLSWPKTPVERMSLPADARRLATPARLWGRCVNPTRHAAAMAGTHEDECRLRLERGDWRAGVDGRDGEPVLLVGSKRAELTTTRECSRGFTTQFHQCEVVTRIVR